MDVVKRDLFSAKKCALAHCVSADLRMGKGIALEFRNRFGGLQELHAQDPKIGSVLKLETPKWEGGPLYYLVTKKLFKHKPTLASLQWTLERLRERCEEDGVEELAVPKLGCGLDKLPWDFVKTSIEQAFEGSSVHVTACVIE